MIIKRPRRLRKSEYLRLLVEENRINISDFIYPIFISEEGPKKDPIKSMPGISRFSIDSALQEIEEVYSLGVKAIAPFPNIPDSKKDKLATQSYNSEGFYAKIIRRIKKNFPKLLVFSDCAMDPYSSDGHDGIVDEDGQIENDSTLEILCKMALAQAHSGADFIAPSDMMDGRVGAIRKALDISNFKHVGILSYTAKYASNFYSPFRDALNSAPKKGNKKTYQMNPANSKEALKEAHLDIEEGADILMVKPGLAYLDIIKLLSDNANIPVAAYNVSGEYAMLNAAAEKGWIEYKSTVLETLLSFKRAGASILLSYHAKEVAKWLKR